MKKIVFTFLTLILIGNLALAYESNVKILPKSEITQLSDDALTANYIDVCVEIEATNAFNNTSGFMPKEFKSYKDMLRYRILLIEEMKKRKLEVPQVR